MMATSGMCRNSIDCPHIKLTWGVIGARDATVRLLISKFDTVNLVGSPSSLVGYEANFKVLHKSKQL